MWCLLFVAGRENAAAMLAKVRTSCLVREEDGVDDGDDDDDDDVQ